MYPEYYIQFVSVGAGDVSDSMSLAWGQVCRKMIFKSISLTTNTNQIHIASMASYNQYDVFLNKQKNKSKNHPLSIVLSILIESNTTILRYLITQNLNRINNDILITYLQKYFTMVILGLSELESRLGLENPILFGLYCTVIRNISESKCALLTALTSYSIMAHCYGRVGAEYNSCLTVNNARRLTICGFLTTRSPKLTITKVSLWNA